MSTRLAVGKPSPAPRPAPRPTMPRIRCGRPRSRVASSTAPATRARADPRRGDELAVDERPLDDLERDPGCLAPVAEDLHVAPAVVAEGEVRALHHPQRAELLDDHAVEEGAGGQVQQPRTGAEDADLGDTRLPQQLDLALGPDERDRGLLRAEQGRGVRVEGDRDRRHAGRFGPGTEAGEEGLMPAVDPIEVADSHKSAASPGGKLTSVLDQDHRRAAPCTDSRGRPVGRNTLERAALAW